MAAGQGFKTFATGDVLTAADTNGYLMQGVWTFADATARDAAVTSPQEGNMCYLKSTDAVQYYSGSAWTAVSGGSSGAFTQLATGTLSGASTVVSLTLTGYQDIEILVKGASTSTASTNWSVAFGGTTSIDTIGQYSIAGGAVTNRTTAADSKIDWMVSSIVTIPTTSDARDSSYFYITNVTAAKGKNGYAQIGTAGTARMIWNQGVYLETNAAITSVTFATTSGSFNNGTYTIYGVK